MPIMKLREEWSLIDMAERDGGNNLRILTVSTEDAAALMYGGMQLYN
jgi:hypothetical protein